MQLDKLDIKIQEAVSQFDPAYNEQAWIKMEKLLDEQLPQKKRRNPKLLWIFFLLCIVAGIFLVITNPWNKKGFINEQNNSLNAPREKNIKEPFSPRKSLQNNTINQPLKLPQDQLLVKNRAHKSIKNNKGGQTIISEQAFNDKQNFYSLYPVEKQKNNVKNNLVSDQEDNVELRPTVNMPDFPGIKSIIESKIEKKLIAENKTDISKTKIKSPTKKNTFSNSFSINISAGPDISAVAVDNIGKIKFAYGAGIGYNFGKKWNLRTGFYVEKKMYEAKPYDYHPPTQFWYNYPDLKSIYADCKIYAVPLVVNYTISQNSKHLWFAGAGLSSYFMKKEVYDYNSKSASGQTSYISYTINNKNKHYFSVVRLSAGYEKKLTDKISFVTEPYLTVPLAGVGFGKVKLYSSGILFSLNIKPFAKNK